MRYNEAVCITVIQCLQQWFESSNHFLVNSTAHVNSRTLVYGKMQVYSGNVLHFGVTEDELSFCLVHEVHV